MKVLGISGSPNASGNTAFSVRYALNVLEEAGVTTRYISLANKEIHPCIGCWQCGASRRCHTQDDAEEILDAMRWCDGLLIGSPVYFGMISGPLKMMMDRCVVFRPTYGEPVELEGKIGAGIACGGFRNGGQEFVLQNIQTFMIQQNMRVIGDGPSYCHAGGTIAGEAAQDEVGLQTVRNTALNIKKMLEKK